MDLPTAPSGPPGDGCNNKNDINNQLNSPSPSSSQPPAFGEPSKQRRTNLKKQEQPPITLSNLTPITRYYTAANKVLEQFKAHCAAHEFDEAYIIGRRFALFSTVSLPQHDYYMSPKPELVALRQQNIKDSQWVTTGVERIVGLMDRQELEKQKQQKIIEEQQKKEEEQQQLQWEESMKQRLDAVESKLDAKEEALEAASKNDIEELDMVSKLEQLNAFYAKDENDNATTTPSAPILYGEDDSLPPPIVPPLIGELPLPPPIVPPLIGQSTQDLKSNGATPLFEQPPAYSDIFLESLRTSTTPSSVSPEKLTELERLPTSSSVASSASKKKQSKPKPTPRRTQIRILIRNYERQMQSLQQSKQIEVLKLGTYQGRLSSSNPKYDSTNGCAVISPLVVATHIYPQHIQHNNKKTLQRSTSSKYGISNSDINEIIDKRAPPVLQTVRAKLGLNRHALIIPSDVHDFLVDEHILPQDLFVGVCGGDIMDKSHVNKLITMLVNGKEEDTKSKSSTTTCRHKKVGAALFFREHVISILKIPLGNGACYYDLIDSLPCHKTGMASRTRCKDLASFEVLLSWYASSKFTESNCGFIDGNEYNEWMADFDPRTFQGFVWCEQ